MRKLWGLVAAWLLICFSSGSAVAATSASDEYKVTATIQAACYIILSPQNQITEIITNSQQLVTPQVYYGNITPARRARLTASIYTQYLLLTKHNHGQIGIVYRFSPHDMPAKPVHNNVAYQAPKFDLGKKLFFLKPVGSIFHD